MVNCVILNQRNLKVTGYEQRSEQGLVEISFHFEVSHEEYHEITTLLYEGVFDVEVPEKTLSFRGRIKQYYTSITNLYEADAIGDFYLTLREEAK